MIVNGCEGVLGSESLREINQSYMLSSISGSLSVLKSPRPLGMGSFSKDVK